MIYYVLLLATLVRFQQAVSVDVDIQGNIYAVDKQRNIVMKMSAKGDSLRSTTGYGSGIGQMDGPTAVCAHAGNAVFVADNNNHRIQQFTRQLDYVSSIYTRDNPDEASRFGYPLDVDVTRSGDIVVLDGENKRVVILGADGQFRRSFGNAPSPTGKLISPTKLATDNNDNIYVIDGKSVIMFDMFGNIVRTLTHMDMKHPDDVVAVNSWMLVSDSSTVFVFDAATSDLQLILGLENKVMSMCASSTSMVSLDTNRLYLYSLNIDSILKR